MAKAKPKKAAKKAPKPKAKKKQDVDPEEPIMEPDEFPSEDQAFPHGDE